MATYAGGIQLSVVVDSDTCLVSTPFTFTLVWLTHSF